MMQSSSPSSASSSGGGSLQVQVHPSPFDPRRPFVIEVSGGVPPYQFTARPSPPNPPGVSVVQTGPDTAEVHVQPNTPTGTTVTVDVTDGSNPPQSQPATNTVQ